MTGSGTLLDPYVIWDVNDLQNMNLDLAAYYELGQDINALKPSWSWYPQIRRPSGDFASFGTWTVFPAAPPTQWDKVCEVVQDGNATYITGVTNTSWVLFSFPNFSIPLVAEDISLELNAYIRGADITSSHRVRFQIRVGGVDYWTADYFETWNDWYPISISFKTNPATGLPWIVDDINGVGPDPLQAFGIYCVDAAPDILITQIYARVYSRGFNPVGTFGSSFTGNFDGKGYVISGLVVRRTPADWDGFLGLFGDTTGSKEIKNVGIENCSIIGGFEWIGALIGWHGGGKISNCYSTGTVRAITDIGGLLGYNDATVENCSSSCEVIGEGELYDATKEIGGLIGQNDGEVSHCWATGNVTASSMLGISMVGGFIGIHSVDLDIHHCYATGNVTVIGTKLYEVSLVGGFVGHLNGWGIYQCFSIGDVSAVGVGAYLISIGGFAGIDTSLFTRDCYARGNVHAEHLSDGSEVGGFCGTRWRYSPIQGGIIENSYSTGKVTTVGPFINVGGFCGIKHVTSNITNCFWDTETSGMLVSAGGIGKTTAEMRIKNTFSLWDLITIWAFNEVDTLPATSILTLSAVLNGILYFEVANDGYPYLQWQTVTPSSCGFEWGTSIPLTNTTPGQNKTRGESFIFPLSGLTTGITYYFRSYATSPIPIFGPILNFTIPFLAAEVMTLPATGVT